MVLICREAKGYAMKKGQCEGQCQNQCGGSPLSDEEYTELAKYGGYFIGFVFAIFAAIAAAYLPPQFQPMGMGISAGAAVLTLVYTRPNSPTVVRVLGLLAAAVLLIAAICSPHSTEQVLIASSAVAGLTLYHTKNN